MAFSVFFFFGGRGIVQGFEQQFTEVSRSQVRVTVH